MKIANLSIKNSLLINMISVFIILAGTVCMLQMNREAFPSVSYDIVSINTVYPGAPAEDVEKLVTIPLEKELKGISGIDYMTSTSEESLSGIGIYIDPAARDKNKVVNDIQSAVDRVSNLPDAVDDPSVFELDSKEFPVIEISLRGNIPETVRRKYAESLEDVLQDLDGTASVRRIGWRDKELWVEVDPDKLKTYHISVEDVMSALKSRNVSVPGGQLKTKELEFNVRITGEFETASEIAEVIIRANDAGNWVKVKDVANVVDSFEDEVNIAKVDGQRSTSMVVVKKEQADAIKLVADIRRTVDEFKENLPKEIDVVLTNDFSYYVKRRLGVLKNNGTIGLIFVLLILFVFLDPIPAFMTALGIPIALFTTFIVMHFMGMTINLVTMIGLILVLGMIVDDGIIVSENVYRHLEKGLSPKEAAIKGTNEVVAPVTVTILTTFAAFSPLLFMTDILGKFIRGIPIVVMVALSASLFEAFIILPAHLSDFVKPKKRGHEKGEMSFRDKWFSKIVSFYTRVLKKALKIRYIVLAGLVISLVAAITLVAANVVKRVMFSGEGMEEFYVRAEAQKGIPIEKMNELIKPVEKLISAIPEEDLESYRTYLGAIEQESGFDPNSKRGSHLGQITVFLTPLQHRKRSPWDIMDELRPKLEKIEGFEKLYFFMPKEGPPVGQPVEMGIKGESFEVMQEIATKVKNYLKTVEGVYDIDSSYSYGKKQMKVVVDEGKAKKYYLSISQIASSVRNAFRGGVATTVKPSKAEEEIDVIVRFPKEDRNDVNAFNKILIPNQLGNLIPLTSVAKIEEAEGIYVIKHRDGKRVVYVTAQVDDDKATSLSVNKMLQKKFKEMTKDYVGYTLHFGGEFEDQNKSMKNIGISFLFALFLIFIILVAMFRSLIQPFIVLMAIPFGLVGVILSFWAHDIVGKMLFDVGRPLSFFAFFGVVGLTGIVVNDSIVLVDFINRLRKEGNERMASLIEAGQTRLRPVIMTSITTIGGLVTVAYGIGGGDPFLKPMGLSIIWGLFFATGLTLIGIPCIYAIVDDFSEKVLHKHMVKGNGNKEGLS